MKSFIVAFNSGAYGNFVSWFTTWATSPGLNVNDRPWVDRDGNAHKNDIHYYPTLVEACSTPISGSLIHPKPNADVLLEPVIDRLLSIYEKVVFIYPTNNTLMWNINRKLYNVGREWQPLTEGVFDKDLAAWSPDRKLKTWEFREWLSFIIRKQHIMETELDTCLSIKKDNLIKISFEDLRDNTFPTFKNLLLQLDASIIRSDDEIRSLLEEWLHKQQHKDKDILLKNLVTAIFNGDDIVFPELTLVDTAEIQRALREDHGFEIRCYDLDVWPKSTKELAALLYKDENVKD